MRRSLVCFRSVLLGSLFVFGCAKPMTTTETTGSGNSSGSGSGGSQSSGNGGSQSSGNGGSQSSGNGGSQSSGSGGSQSSGSGGTSSGATGGATGTTCTAQPGQLINSAAWNCDGTDPIAIQGAVYGYTDGSSCVSPQPANICSGSAGCCISGTTVVDSTSAKWGCGIGMELNDAGGTSTKMAYSGPVQCFNLTLTGSSGGNEVRIGFTQKADNTNTVAPFVSIAAFTNGWTGKLCFTDANCPSWATTAQCSKAVGSAGTPYDMQIQVSAGQTTASVGAYNVCVSSIVPVTSSSTGTGGSGGGNSTCTSPSGTGTITDQYGTGVVGCGSKEYIVQNNEWGSTAGQTITYGPGANFKVTVQKGTGANNNPEGFPSVFTGANSNHDTGSSSGLPLAVSSIQKGGVMTSMTWAANGATGDYNATYDVWFSTGGKEAAAAAPSGGYLMVWYHKPVNAQPIGTQGPSVMIGGKNWNVWYGQNSGNNKPCVSYVAPTDIPSLTYSLGDFIQDAVGRGYVQNSWALTNVFAGFEIWNGGVGLAVTDFSVTVP